MMRCGRMSAKVYGDHPRWCSCRPSPKVIKVPTFVVIKATETEKKDSMKDTMIGVYSESLKARTFRD